jgi:uncharacterized membrane protein YgdD (TMEM256/DUF423 family)
MTFRPALACAAILMAVAVALGAFGAHALRTRLAPDALVVWQTAVNYHAWHALGLLGAGVLMAQFPHARGLRRAAWLFVAGIALFCGSLYALALGAPSAVGIATPFGGAAFIAGWLMLACSTWRLPVAPRSDAR